MSVLSQPGARPQHSSCLHLFWAAQRQRQLRRTADPGRPGRKEYGALAPAERVDVLRLLVRLAEATAAARERLASDDAANKAMRSELFELRQKVKRCVNAKGGQGGRVHGRLPAGHHKQLVKLLYLLNASEAHATILAVCRSGTWHGSECVFFDPWKALAAHHLLQTGDRFSRLGCQCLRTCREREERVEKEKERRKEKEAADAVGANATADAKAPEPPKMCALPSMVVWLGCCFASCGLDADGLHAAWRLRLTDSSYLTSEEPLSEQCAAG